MDLEPMDVGILELLQEDGRRTYADLADEMDRAESTVRDHVGRLEDQGVVQRYTAVLDARTLGLSGRALVRARVPGDRLQEAFDGLLSVPEVTNVHHTSGERNLDLVVTAADMGDLQEALRRISAAVALRRMKVDVVLRTVHRSRPLPLRDLLADEDAALAGREG